MKLLHASAPFEPFLLPAGRGERFCMYHPAPGMPRGAILYVHPFAEEMNKSRRMAAIQSRMLAASGYAVLQIDLYGCGDSDGELRYATWESWKSDLGAAERWIRQRVSAPVYLWGLRLGALLAVDYAKDGGERFAGYLLWQPVLTGEALIAQFLRLRVATGFMGAGEKTSTQDLRKALDEGHMLEVAGYDLTPALAAAIASANLAGLHPRGGVVYWFELVAEEGRPLSPASRRVIDAWSAHGVTTEVRTVAGETFWNTVEPVDNAALLAATTDALARLPACA